MTTRRTLLAPIDGWVLPLGEVPDEVFASGLAGDGVAIDPTGDRLQAPCAGVLTWPGRARHAASIRTPEGIDVLVHVGIDTVALEAGLFSPCAADGARVGAGEPLLRFDLDAVCRRARSAVTPILVAHGAPATILTRVQGRRVRAGEPLMEMTAAGDAAARDIVAATAVIPTSAIAPGPQLRRSWRLPFDHGLHARPASLIVTSLKGLDVQARAHCGARQADLRSVTALMALGARRGDRMEIALAGRDAATALAALERVFGAPGEDAAIDAAPRNATTVLAAPTGATAASVNACWRGIAAVRGIALGVAVHWRTEDPEIAAIGQGLEAERAALAGALSAVRERIERKAAGAKAHRGIFEAHRALLEDPELTNRAEDALRRGASAGAAWRAAIEAATATLRASGETRIAERAADLRDLRTQVLRALAGLPAEVAVELPPQAVLIAEELLPSQWLELDHDRLAGVAMAAGGATSHVAILAAARGIPLLVALGPAVLTIAPGSEVILDAETGELIAHPDLRRLRDTTATLAARETERAADLAAAHAPCVSADGVPVTVNANLGSLEDARLALTNGADGCGLLRTEFLFLDRAEAPDEDEQAEVYQRIADALDGRPLTIRTLDAGGDKPIAYLPLPPEENPALGLRGIRTSLYQPALLATQLRAILRVRPAGVCRILLPMVSGLGEVRTVRAALEEARASVGAGTTTPVGVMVETPAAALLAGQLAAETDFFSIGTNDLSQYVLAMDRGHATLAAALDALHPAVLRLIAATAEAGRRAGRPVAVCGALASDVLAVPVLLGLGVHELSAVPALVPRLKRLIRGLELAACARLAERALDCIDGAAVRRLVADWSRRGGHDDVE